MPPAAAPPSLLPVYIQPPPTLSTLALQKIAKKSIVQPHRHRRLPVRLSMWSAGAYSGLTGWPGAAVAPRTSTVSLTPRAKPSKFGHKSDEKQSDEAGAEAVSALGNGLIS